MMPRIQVIEGNRLLRKEFKIFPFTIFEATGPFVRTHGRKIKSESKVYYAKMKNGQEFMFYWYEVKEI